VRCIALDMRGHGQSTATPPPVRWRQFGLDTAYVTRELGLHGVLGVGHSMGAHAIALAASLNAGAFAGLLLLDPVILPPRAYGRPWVEEHFARKRRRAWSSPEEMRERFSGRPPFDRWDPAVLRDYCQYAIRAGELACAPEIEGSVYENSSVPQAAIFDEIAMIQAPAWIVRSARPRSEELDMLMSPCWPGLAARFPRGHDAVWEDTLHFLPMERPDRTADWIRERLPHA
jgi:pimeloyl-ACP methyl ester carboxylesterase